ncbi:hypothetical protein CANARDRAFT_30967 [[Candida] arabinofermentans NRRL YB-2248]|uniref:Uncharacterized protein n=1 Tax=[Candida] arabinofermentans NRRL YB-2248 TaxID=983967 RepID=A0A1E4T7K7_9ASCO|nr:hypothetical protein CANARDRAFT_30967 [[Candida] arabinofermentans NRRL YB-2248]
MATTTDIKDVSIEIKPSATTPPKTESDEPAKRSNGVGETNKLSDKLLSTILKVSTESIATAKSENDDTSISNNADDELELKINNLIIRLSSPPDDSVKQPSSEETLNVLKLSLIKIRQLKLYLSFVKSNEKSRMERWELERDIMLKEIEFIKNRQQTQSTVSSDLLSPNNIATSPTSYYTHNGSRSLDTNFDSPLPKLHNMTPTRHVIQSPTQQPHQKQQRQIKIVNAKSLSSSTRATSRNNGAISRRSSYSNLSTPSRSLNISTISADGENAALLPGVGSPTKKRKEQPQFFHYYTNDMIENDWNSVDNRRNKKKKSEDSIMDNTESQITSQVDDDEDVKTTLSSNTDQKPASHNDDVDEANDQEVQTTDEDTSVDEKQQLE